MKNYILNNSIFSNIFTNLHHHFKCFINSIKQLFKNPLKYFLFMIPISICIFLVLISYNFTKNIEINLKNDVEKVIIFLKNNISVVEIDYIKKEILKNYDVITFNYYDEKESLELYLKINKGRKIINNEDYNPFPKTIIIEKKVSKSILNNNKINLFLENNKFIDSFNSNDIFLKRINFFKNILLNILVISLLFLFFVLSFFINYYMKIEISSNKNKIYIYNLLGARDSYIRREYIYLPVLLGFLSFMLGYVFFQFFYYFFFTTSLDEILTAFSIPYSFINISFVEAAFGAFSVIIIMLAVCIFTINKYLKQVL